MKLEDFTPEEQEWILYAVEWMKEGVIPTPREGMTETELLELEMRRTLEDRKMRGSGLSLKEKRKRISEIT